jgi:putative exosortase-associated protein (TIGR04073 family)
MVTISSNNTMVRWLAAWSTIALMVISSPAGAQDGVFQHLLDVCPSSVSSMDASADAANAAKRSVIQPMVVKLGRGLGNLTLGWVEVPKQVTCVSRERGWLSGIMRGTIDGVGMSVARMIAGVYEIVTFPIPIPPRYQPMVMPEYVWNPERFSEQ